MASGEVVDQLVVEGGLQGAEHDQPKKAGEWQMTGKGRRALSSRQQATNDYEWKMSQRLGHKQLIESS